MKTILIYGLPGSGKTTLANALVKYMGNAVHFNADQVREQHNDWDFTPEGRHRQMQRMKQLCAQTVSEGMYAIADFVCPLREYRSQFGADVEIWMHTLEISRYEDTNKLFEVPLLREPTFTITDENWWEVTTELTTINAGSVDKWARKLAVAIRDWEFREQNPTTQMLGRFQPFHKGHFELFKRALSKHGQVAIMVRDMPTSPSNPFGFDQIKENIEYSLADYAGKFRIYKVPNIVNITYGRDVGYKIEQEDLGEEIHKISATSIRESMKKSGLLP